MSNSTDEKTIQTLIEGWCAAVCDKNIDAIMGYYAPDIVAFDAISTLQFRGAEAYRKHWEFCLGMCEGGMLFETHQLVIHADGHVAFAHWLHKCGGTDDKGEVKYSWMRASAGYCKTADGWKAVHEHFSAPFDMASGEALFDLQPTSPLA